MNLKTEKCALENHCKISISWFLKKKFAFRQAYLLPLKRSSNLEKWFLGLFPPCTLKKKAELHKVKYLTHMIDQIISRETYKKTDGEKKRIFLS